MKISRPLIWQYKRLPISRWVQKFCKNLFPWEGKFFFPIDADWRDGPISCDSCDLSSLVDSISSMSMNEELDPSGPYSKYVEAFVFDMKNVYKLNGWPYRGLDFVDAWCGPQEYIGNCNALYVQLVVFLRTSLYNCP